MNVYFTMSLSGTRRGRPSVATGRGYPRVVTRIRVRVSTRAIVHHQNMEDKPHSFSVVGGGGFDRFTRLRYLVRCTDKDPKSST